MHVIINEVRILTWLDVRCSYELLHLCVVWLHWKLSYNVAFFRCPLEMQIPWNESYVKPHPERLSKWLRVTQLAWKSPESKPWFLIGHSSTHFLLSHYHLICLSAFTHSWDHMAHKQKIDSLVLWRKGLPASGLDDCTCAGIWNRARMFYIWCRNRPRLGPILPEEGTPGPLALDSPGDVVDTEKHVRSSPTPMSLWLSPLIPGESPEQPRGTRKASSINK